MTTTVLPLSTSRCSTSSSKRTSSKCSPVVGSSRMYRVRPVSPFGELGGELDALGLAAREGRRRLSKVDVSQTYVIE